MAEKETKQPLLDETRAHLEAVKKATERIAKMCKQQIAKSVDKEDVATPIGQSKYPLEILDGVAENLKEVSKIFILSSTPALKVGLLRVLPLLAEMLEKCAERVSLARKMLTEILHNQE